jgi:transposase
MVAHPLRGYDLGSSEEPPAHYLLLDREARTLSVAPVAEAQRLLREQWRASEQPEPGLVFSEQEWEQFIQDLTVPIFQLRSAQIAERWREHRRLVEQLGAWLAEKWEGAE